MLYWNGGGKKMAVSISLLGGVNEEFSRHLCTEREFREFRRWCNKFGEYPTLNSFSLRYDGDQRAIFTYNADKQNIEVSVGDISLYDLLKELVDVASKTVTMAEAPDSYNSILYSLMEMSSDALQQELTLVIY